MSYPMSTAVLAGLFLAASAVEIARRLAKGRLPWGVYLRHVWLFFLAFVVAEIVSPSVGVWVLAPLCFWALREYLSLVDLRLQDRLGILGAYLSIPFMIYYIQIDWYNMFIISIPVYCFLAIPLLVALGGKESQGAVFSIGAIDFGLFLFVYCLGHIGYLMVYSAWKAAMLIIAVGVCNVTARVARSKVKALGPGVLVRYFLPVPLTVALCLLLSGWTGIPAAHSIALGALIPVLVAMGDYTIDYIKADLGIREDALAPGRGEILTNLQSLFFAAPVVFHYIRYFLT